MARNPAVTLDPRLNRTPIDGLLMYGLLAPPLVWAIQLYLNFGVASHACFPGELPRASFLPGWEQSWVALLAVNLVCAALCAIGLVASASSWRDLRNRPESPIEADRQATDPSDEQRRSFAAAGIMLSALFTAAILFDAIYLWALSTCSQV
jgi:hypothetical protein